MGASAINLLLLYCGFASSVNLLLFFTAKITSTNKPHLTTCLDEPVVTIACAHYKVKVSLVSKSDDVKGKTVTANALSSH